jgi:complement component 1 Q subcomponent-binding protein, mitochondrial
MSLFRAAVRQLVAPSSRALALRSSLPSTRTLTVSRISAALPAARASFSVSARRFGEGTSACFYMHLVLRYFTYPSIHPSTLTADGDVSAKISEEIAYEKESAVEGEPEFLQEFKKTGIWTVCPFFPFISFKDTNADPICIFFSC